MSLVTCKPLIIIWSVLSSNGEKIHCLQSTFSLYQITTCLACLDTLCNWTTKNSYVQREIHFRNGIQAKVQGLKLFNWFLQHFTSFFLDLITLSIFTLISMAVVQWNCSNCCICLLLFFTQEKLSLFKNCGSNGICAFTFYLDQEKLSLFNYHFGFNYSRAIKTAAAGFCASLHRLLARRASP